MEKTKKTAKVFLVISILLMFVSAIVASAVQTNGGKVRMEELNIMTDEGYTMSAYTCTCHCNKPWLLKQ